MIPSRVIKIPAMVGNIVVISRLEDTVASSPGSDGVVTRENLRRGC